MVSTRPPVRPLRRGEEGGDKSCMGKKQGKEEGMTEPGRDFDFVHRGGVKRGGDMCSGPCEGRVGCRTWAKTSAGFEFG